LRPRGDALEYEEVGRNIARGEGFALLIGNRKYRPAHPVGLPMLLAGYFLFADEGPGSGIRVILVCSLAAIAGTWWMGRVAGGGASAVVATLLLALAPLHVQLSRAVMSDVPASAAIALVGAWSLRALSRRTSLLTWGSLGAASGVAAAIRQANVLIVVPIAVMATIEADTTRDRLRRLGALGLGTMLGLAPALAYAAVAFGAPWRDGLALWVPGAHFGWDIPRFRPEGAAQPNWRFYGSMLAGFGELYSPAASLLLALGIVVGMRLGGAARHLVVFALGVVCVTLAAYLPFFTQSSRYAIAMLPPLAGVAALPFAARAPRWASAVGAALLAATLTSPTATRRPLYRTPDKPSGETAALQNMATKIEPNAAVLAHANTMLFERIVRPGGDRVWIPLGLDSFQVAIALGHVEPFATRPGAFAWMHEPVVRPSDAEGLEQVIRELRAQGRPVYLCTMAAREVPFMDTLLRMFQRLGATRIDVGRGVALLRLDAPSHSCAMDLVGPRTSDIGLS
jgi:hypothetical protein